MKWGYLVLQQYYYKYYMMQSMQRMPPCVFSSLMGKKARQREQKYEWMAAWRIFNIKGIFQRRMENTQPAIYLSLCWQSDGKKPDTPRVFYILWLICTHYATIVTLKKLSLLPKESYYYLVVVVECLLAKSMKIFFGSPKKPFLKSLLVE